MNTREKILDKALDHFNQSGTAEISTNHIAEAAGVSPGNLYYYFRNKREIIHELFQRLYAKWETELTLTQDRKPVLNDLVKLIETNYRIIWQYRFIYREMVVLLRQDAELRVGFIDVRQRGYKGFQQLFHAFSDAGVVNFPKDPQTVHELQEICWLISEFWIANLEINGRSVDETEMQNGVKLMLRVLQPYLR